MLLSPFSSLLGEAETVVTICKHNIDIIINTHTVTHSYQRWAQPFPKKGTHTRQQVDAV